MPHYKYPLAKLARAKGYKLDELAARLEVTEAAIQDWSMGKRRPNAVKLGLLVDLLECDVRELNLKPPRRGTLGKKRRR